MRKRPGLHPVQAQLVDERGERARPAGLAAAAVLQAQPANARPAEPFSYKVVYDDFTVCDELEEKLAEALPAEIERDFEGRGYGDLKKELAGLRASQALSSFNQQLSNVQRVQDVNVMAMDVPNSNVDTLRSLADKFRENTSASDEDFVASRLLGDKGDPQSVR